VTVPARLDGVGQTEFTLARAVVLFRVGGLVEIGVVAAHDAPSYGGHGPVIMALLAAAITAESAVLSTACIRARRVRPWWAVADLVFTVAVLAADAKVDAHYGALYVAYPYSVICSVAFGIGLRRLNAVLAATAFLAAGYLYGGGYLHADPTAHVAVNAITYFPNTVVAWAVSRQLRRMGGELEASRQSETALARDQERLRHARMLHDRVLQTMETLARGQWITDASMQARVAEEAVWLRDLVQGSGAAAAGDLLSQFTELTVRAARDGLHVELNCATFPGPAGLAALCPRRGAALVGAVSEALTNVVKHAGTASAVLRLAGTPTALTVTVLDRGRGFDPATRPEGMGLKESIRGRITEEGGTVRIDTAPGTGTYIEIIMPLSSGLQPDGDRVDSHRHHDNR
jgi:signal transduction histidine kinase